MEKSRCPCGSLVTRLAHSTGWVAAGWRSFVQRGLRPSSLAQTRDHRGGTIAVSFAAKNQSHVYLESFSKKFKKDITDERGYHGNFKIGSGNNISDCPSYTPLQPHA
jgi:hypothetical protein